MANSNHSGKRERIRFGTQLLLCLTLILTLCNLRAVAMTGISGYRKFISPALGIHCGYAHAMHAESCSAYSQRVIGEEGFYRGLTLSVQRFRACANLASTKMK